MRKMKKGNYVPSFQTVAIWVMIICRFLDGQQHFRRTCCFHLQIRSEESDDVLRLYRQYIRKMVSQIYENSSRWRQNVLTKHRYPPVQLHDITSQRLRI
jgi:hypothetical protein